MNMTDQKELPLGKELVWQALNDMELLKTCIPGCESIQVKEEAAVSNTTTVCGVYVSRRPWQAVAQSAWFRHAGVVATVRTPFSFNHA